MGVALRVVREIWVGASCAVLAVALFDTQVRGAEEWHVVMGWVMVVLAFPASLAGVLLGAGGAWVALRLGVPHAGEGFPFGLIVFWALLFSLGYLQWFVVVPRALARMKHHTDEAKNQEAD